VRRLALAALVIAAPVLAAKFELPRQSFLIDDIVPIVVSGLTPGQSVTIRLRGGAWSSSEAFIADANGAVNVSDPMRLFWSAERDRSIPLPAPAPRPGIENPPEPWQLSAEVKGTVVATTTLQRRAVAENVSVRLVHDQALVGVFYQPPGEGRHPAMLVLGGSGGGVPPASSFAGGLASRGYTVLALGYFGVDGLPPSLTRIPLEYFKTALDWMAAQPGVDPARIGILGASRGAELALLLGSIYPQQIRTVIAYLPSNVVWPSCCERMDEPSWTLEGRPIAWASPRRANDFMGRERAAIQVERIHGGVLLISGRQDGVWHSTEMSDAIMDRLRRSHFAYPFKHLAYDDAGHAIGRPYTPTTDIDNVRHPLTGRLMHLGGTPAGTAHAREDAWRQVLAFLDEQLQH
jgi:dienelactone hydrolase